MTVILLRKILAFTSWPHLGSIWQNVSRGRSGPMQNPDAFSGFPRFPVRPSPRRIGRRPISERLEDVRAIRYIVGQVTKQRA
ncbi:MAG: hypothetical protein EA424_20930 [Planctomycetaceae bacterium]|nr:MAG: hypothetical protein EA424_20930 [Planctomycetaceae bacterium]